jgi:hypothetical protein
MNPNAQIGDSLKGLKPNVYAAVDGVAKATPFQTELSDC